MAELLGGGPAVTNGNGGSTSRPTAPPAQTGSPSQGIRGPRAIMHARQEREAARQRAEREQMERERAEQEARLLEEQRQRQERRAQAAGAGGPSHVGGGGGGDIPAAPQPSDPISTQRRQRQTSDPQARPSQQQTSTRISQNPGTQQQQQRPSRNPAAQGAPPQFPTGVPQAAQTTAGGAGQTGESSTAAGTRPRNSFPHAFERWEALSAHWEGLTSFWIRKLQQHAEDIDRDPVSSQLSRQVTDLSAAGANLFHAVVELQRLRASSERKFQRWFFETRAELERHQEVNAMLEAALEEERRGRSDAIRDAVEHERANSKTQKRMTEMQKELTISKEEARRAWEELGRREQEERDRTISLQQGLPTIVGGVQVVPMTQGVPSRHGSSRDPRSQPQPENPEYGSQQQGYGDYSQAPPVQPTTSTAAGPSGTGGFYQQPQATVHHEGGSAYSGGGGSEGGYSEGEYAIDAQGNFIRDSRGHKVPFRAPGTPGDDRSDSGTEDYETPVAQPAGGVSYPPSSSQYAGGQHPPQQQQPYSGTGPDYSGSGYAAPGWETVPRHHHPTRLSDVIEEDDERSRTSASQVSRG